MLLGSSAEQYRWFLYPQEAQSLLRGTATTPPTASPFTPKCYSHPTHLSSSVWDSSVQSDNEQTSDQRQKEKETSSQRQKEKQTSDQRQEGKHDQSDQQEESELALVGNCHPTEMYHNRTQSHLHTAMATASTSACFHCPPKCILKPTMEVG